MIPFIILGVYIFGALIALMYRIHVANKRINVEVEKWCKDSCCRIKFDGYSNQLTKETCLSGLKSNYWSFADVSFDNGDHIFCPAITAILTWPIGFGVVILWKPMVFILNFFQNRAIKKISPKMNDINDVRDIIT